MIDSFIKSRVRSSFAFSGEFFVHHAQPVHHGIVIFLAPGPDDVFLVVAKQGVKHDGPFDLFNNNRAHFELAGVIASSVPVARPFGNYQRKFGIAIRTSNQHAETRYY
jgi:hypothetical protein